MTDGIEICDGNGKLQFNGEMLTYALRVSGVTYVQNVKVGNTSTTSLVIPTTNTYTNSLVALGGADSTAAAAIGVNASGQRLYATGNAPVGTAFNYYVFEKSNLIPGTNFGLEVRNAYNEITFSSNQRTMRVLNMLGSPRNGEQSVSYGGRNLAYCQGAPAGHRISGEISSYSGGILVNAPGDGVLPPGNRITYTWRNDGKMYGGCTYNGGQTVNSKLVTFDDVKVGPTSDPTQPPDFYKELSLFVIDVTGYPIGATFF